MQSELRDKVPLLRGFPAENKLVFDADLNPKKPFKSGSWTLAGFQIKKIETKQDSIMISGDRIGFAFDPKPGMLVKVSLNQGIKIRIEGAFSSNTVQLVENIVKKLFVTGNELTNLVPDYWKPYLMGELTKEHGLKRFAASTHQSRNSPAQVMENLPNGDPLYRIGTGVNPPRPIHSPDPDYSQEARAAGFQGVSVLLITIDKTGSVGEIYVEQPAGVGLDEAAVSAVRGWKFQPASKQGDPVHCVINVEVNFRLN